MPRLPAFCRECGAVFASPLRAAAAGDENAFPIPVPCPVCQGSGRVPGELLEICVEAARVFADPGEAGGDAFLSVLSDPPEAGDAPGEELLSRTARRAPGFVELVRRLPADSPAVVRGVGRLLRRVRDEVAGGRPGDGDGQGAGRDGEPGAGRRRREAPDAGLEAVVLRAVEAFLGDEGVEPPDPGVPEEVARARDRLDEAGRNDPCPCGSGDKYKDCHWVPDLRTTRS